MWEGGSGWGTYVNPWLIHVNVWQKLLQYCKVISLQLIKKIFHCFTSASLKLMPRFPTVFLLTLVQGHYLWGCRGWQAARTWVSVSPGMVGFPAPSGHLEPANQQAPQREQRENRKARKCLSLNKSLRTFVPIELLCKHVTNPLKPAINRVCIPYKFG